MNYLNTLWDYKMSNIIHVDFNGDKDEPGKKVDFDKIFSTLAEEGLDESYIFCIKNGNPILIGKGELDTQRIVYYMELLKLYIMTI